MDGLLQGAVFIRRTHQPGLSAGGRMGSQGEHMPDNDVLLQRRQLKILSGVFQGRFRVDKAVQALSLTAGVVPVVEKIVVEQRPADERLLIHPQPQHPGQQQAGRRHIDAVAHNGGGTVLIQAALQAYRSGAALTVDAAAARAFAAEMLQNIRERGTPDAV